MLINLLSQLGIISILLTQITQQVEVITLQVEELLTPQVVEIVIEEPEVILEEVELFKEIKDQPETGWYNLVGEFDCKYDREICKCQIKEFRSYEETFKITAREIDRTDCQYCGEFEKIKNEIVYDPLNKKYLEVERGYCIEKPCEHCDTLDYWVDTMLDCDLFTGAFNRSCREDWSDRYWQEHHYHECWMNKCVDRGVNNYRYLSNQGNWVETELPQDYSTNPK